MKFKFAPRLIFTSFIDGIGSYFLFYGLSLTKASSYQMLRGSVIIFTGAYQKFFMKKKFSTSMYVGMMLFILGLLLVEIPNLSIGQGNKAIQGMRRKFSTKFGEINFKNRFWIFFKVTALLLDAWFWMLSIGQVERKCCWKMKVFQLWMLLDWKGYLESFIHSFWWHFWQFFQNTIRLWITSIWPFYKWFVHTFNFFPTISNYFHSNFIFNFTEFFVQFRVTIPHFYWWPGALRLVQPFRIMRPWWSLKKEVPH